MALLQLFPWGDPGRLVTLAQQLVEFVVAATVVYLVGRLVVVPAAEWALGRRAVDPTLAAATKKVLRSSVAVVAVLAAARFAGFTGLLGGSALLAAAATLALGFAARDVIANFVAGAFIVRDRHFSIGDWIEWDENVGVIDDISFRVTRVRTFDNEVVTVPNTQLATTAVTNRTTGETLRVSVVFGVADPADVEATRRIVREVTTEHPRILDEPGASMRVLEIAGDSVDVHARFWIPDPDRRLYSRVRSEFLQRVGERCADAGIEVGTVTDLDVAGELAVSDAADPDGGLTPG